ncbi:MAG: hypothetical protein WCE94_15730 [Candidatus Methanoperedens sp.]
MKELTESQKKNWIALNKSIEAYGKTRGLDKIAANLAYTILDSLEK